MRQLGDRHFKSNVLRGDGKWSIAISDRLDFGSEFPLLLGDGKKQRREKNKLSSFGFFFDWQKG